MTFNNSILRMDLTRKVENMSFRNEVIMDMRSDRNKLYKTNNC